MAQLCWWGEGARAGRVGGGSAPVWLVVSAVAIAMTLAPATAQTDPERGYATQPFTPKTFRMPDGQGCGGDVARWRAVQDNDYASGNIGLKVYHEIQAEIGRADGACQAGRDAEARGMIHASKRRHGYPD